MTRPPFARTVGTLLVACVALWRPPTPASAVDTFWSNPRGDGSGTFNSATNWSPSLPLANDIAHFGMTTSSLDPKTYTVSFTAGASNQGLVVEDDRVTFDLSGGSYGTHINSIGTVAGRTGQLTITNGNWFGNGLTGGTLNIGNAANAAGVLTVSTGATVIREGIRVGAFGPGTLVVQNGGSVTSTDTFIGSESTGAATVTGTNSIWTLEGLNVGARNTGTLNISAGGKVQNSGDCIVGNLVGSSGTVNVDGANSNWTNAGTVELGEFGNAVVNITGGAHATLATTYIGPVQAAVNPLIPGTGKVTVSGVNSQLSGSIEIGGRLDGSGSGELEVSAGGLVQSTGVALTIGLKGEGKVSITSGGRIEAATSAIGGFGGVGIASVSGAGSQWINTGNFDVAVTRGQGTLTISNGGLVQNVNGEIGPTIIDETSAAVVTVTGAASEWKNSGTLTVGKTGTGTLNISAGGVVRSANGFVGSPAGSPSAVTIDGFSSKWINSADIHIGTSGNGSVTVSNGGAVQTQNVFVESHGSLGGNGAIIGNVQNNGLVAPGASIGALEINGAFAQQPGGVLEIEVGGASGSHVDLLNVGAATLDGELRLKLIAGIVPDVNVALMAASLSGQFANVASGQRLATVDGGGSFVVNYGPGSPFNPNQIVLSDFVPGINGDFDQDGDVDGNDFLVWQRGGSPNPISAADLAAWRGNFGFPGLAAIGAVVPEPHAIWLALAPTLGIYLFRRRGWLQASTKKAFNPRAPANQ